jgi:hypothetical protein
MSFPAPAGLFVDTNLLVLYTVGSINRQRIATFKRTSGYREQDYDLLLRFLSPFRLVYTVPHVLAEVSNLIDLPGPEGLRAKYFLKELISSLEEAQIPSKLITSEPSYQDLGLADAAIGMVARTKRCTVLTDDKALYLYLLRTGVEVIFFTYLRDRALES